MADNSLILDFGVRDGVSPALKGMESNIIRFVGAVSAAVAAVSTIAFPVVSSAAYQRELLEAAKTTNYTREQTNELRKGLTEMSKQIDVTAPDLAKIATMGGQLGIGSGGNTGALLAFTEEIARAVTALDIPAEEAATSFGKLINIFDIPASEFRNAISALNEVSNVSNATASELFDVTRRIGNLGGSVDFTQATALSATMIDLGLTAETAGTTVTKIFANMKAKASDFAAVMGQSTGQWIETVNTNGIDALNQYLDKLNQLPTEEAARLKVALTGGGRIFEAVSKLQAQRERGLAIGQRALAVEKQAEAVKASGGGDTTQYAALVKQADALNKAATNVSVLARLTKSATEAWVDGTSAMREQQVVLGGLGAQWRVFQNNVAALSYTLGDQLLTPLTNALKSVGATISSDANLAQVSEGIRDIGVAASVTTNIISNFVESLGELGSSTGVDLAAGLRLGALVAALGVAKLAMGALGVTFRALLANVPGLGALAGVIFGTTRAVAEQEAAVVRTASAWGRLVAGVTGVASSMQAYRAAQAQVTAASQAHAVATLNAQRAQARLGQIYAAQPAQMQTLQRMTVRLAATEAEIVVASAAGNAARVRGLEQYRTRLQATIAAAQRAALSVAEANAIMAASGLELAALDAELYRLSSAYNKVMVTSIAAWGRMATAARAAAAAVAQAGGKIAAGFVRSGAAGGSLASLIVVLNAVKNSTVGVVAGVNNITRALGLLAIEKAGLTELWLSSDRFIIRSTIAVASALRLFGVAARGAISLLSRATGVAFFAYMIYSITEMLGLLEPLKASIVSLLEVLGVGKDNIPDFLKSQKEIDATTKSVEEQAKAWDKATEAAKKYTQQVQANATVLADDELASKELTYDAKNPTKSVEALANGMRDITILEAQRNGLAEQRRQLEQDESAQLAKKKKLLEDIKNTQGDSLERQSNSGNSGYSYIISDAIIETKTEKLAELEGTIASTAESFEILRKAEANLVEADGGLLNLAKSALDAKDATALLTKNQLTGTSMLEEYAAAVEKVAIAQDRVSELSKNTNVGDNSDSADATSLLMKREVDKANAKVTALQEVADGLKSRIAKEVDFSAPVLGLIKGLVEDAPGTSRQIASNLTAAFDAAGAQVFSGSNKPTITAKDMIDAAAQITVKKQLVGTYTAWAEAAKAKAKEAENAVTKAVTDAKARALDLVKTLDGITRQANRNSELASNQRADRAVDSQERIAASKRQADNEIEMTLLREKYTLQNNFLTEQQNGGINVSRQLADNYREEAAAITELEEKHRAAEQAATDRVDASRSRRDVADQLNEFNRLRSESEGYASEIDRANELLRSGTNSTQEQLEAVRQRDTAIQNMVSNYSQLESIGKSIVDTAPVGGVELVKAPDIAKIKAGLSAASASVSTAQIAGAEQNSRVYTQVASEAQVASQQMKEEVNQLTTSLDAMAKGVGTTAEAVLAGFESMANSSGVLQKITAEVTNFTNSNLGELNIVPKIDADAFGATLQTQLTTAAKSQSWSVTPQLTFAEGELQNTADKLTGQLKDVRPEVGVDLVLDAEGIAKLNAQFSQLGATLTVNGNGVAPVKRAAGGSVFGAGTATSDSIPAWLSNGEHVIDAQTTKLFGHGFFDFIRKLGRGGAGGIAQLGRLGVPRFAGGGAVAYKAGKLSGIANDFNKSSDETSSKMEITINSGGKKATIQAEREQANALVGILRHFDKG